MDRLEYKGTTYIRTNKKWTDTRGIVAPEMIQKELNSLFLESLDLSEMTFDDIIKQADALKESTSYHHSVRLYEYAVEIAEESSSLLCCLV